MADSVPDEVRGEFDSWLDRYMEGWEAEILRHVGEEGKQPVPAPPKAPDSPFRDKSASPDGVKRWVTIGGESCHPEAGEHCDGTPVELDDEGRIVKGPGKLVGRNVSRLDKRDKPKAETKPTRLRREGKPKPPEADKPKPGEKTVGYPDELPVFDPDREPLKLKVDKGKHAGRLVNIRYPTDHKELDNLVRYMVDNRSQIPGILDYLGISQDMQNKYGGFSHTLEEMLHRHHNPVHIGERIKRAEAVQAKVKSIAALPGEKELNESPELLLLTKRIRKLADRTNELTDAAAKIAQDMLAEGVGGSLREKLGARLEEIRKETDSISKRDSRLRTERTRLRRQKQGEILDKLLKVDNPSPMAAGSFEPGHSEAEREAVGEAARWLTHKVARGPEGETVPPYTIVKDDSPMGGRPRPSAYYRSSSHAINVHSGMDSVATNVHEMGHGIEYKLPGVQSAAMRFLKYRVGDQQPRRLNEVVAGKGYADWEMGRDDEFGKAFGKDSAWYVGKGYSDGATEVVSMGVEMLYKDPVGFATKDPEFASFIIGILDGSLRDNPVP